MIWVELPQTRNAFYNLKHSRLVRKKLDVCAHTIYKKTKKHKIVIHSLATLLGKPC